MGFFFSKTILTNQAEIIPANIKNDPIAAIAQQVGRGECFLNVGRLAPIGISGYCAPVIERVFTVLVSCYKIGNTLNFNDVYFHNNNC